MSLKIDFTDFKRAVLAGIQTGEYPFTQSLISQWLEKYPRDIEAEILEARLDLKKGNTRKSRTTLGNIVKIDPENSDCLKLAIKAGGANLKFQSSALFVLTGETEEISSIYPWATTIRALRNEIKKNNKPNAEKLLQLAIKDDPDNIYLALEHAKYYAKTKDQASILHLLEIYQKRWPECVAFKLLKALLIFKSHNENKAVSLLHTCARLDPGGVVALRLLGSSHEFLSIFPKNRGIDFQGEIPISIALRFEWTQLPSGKLSKAIKSDGAAEKTENIDSRLAVNINAPNSPQSEKVYVILTSYSGLNAKYGPKSAEVIIEQLDALSQAIETNPRWKPLVFIPDKADCAANFGLDPLEEIDPWKIKLSLMDLNTLIGKSNTSIGAVLIIGNHDVLPFHRLPNPTEDSDSYVLSDNPYATTTSNYLLPEWIVGRLPGEMAGDPGLLMQQIRHITEFHKNAHHSQGLAYRIIQIFKRLKNFGRFIREIITTPNDFGYSAEVWRRSSITAFRPIGKGADLRDSPPYDNDTIDVEKLFQAKCAYFNLHGLPNSNEWYGQKDFSETLEGPDFPVAISTDIIEKVINNIDMVFTEACYGGYIFNKKIEESMALKLLDIGSQGVVGSSCIAYGSVFTPLIGADLLAFIFWKYIKDGYSFGSALRQAKIGLIKVMMQRQGYLDGEDQKTLLSFNLYGDPLGCLEEVVFLGKENENGIVESDLSLVNDSDGILGGQTYSDQTISKDIKEVLESYVPGLENAKMRVRKQKVRLVKMINGSQSPKIGSNLEFKKFTQIVYEKKISINKQKHNQFARVTIDEAGKVVKLAISR